MAKWRKMAIEYFPDLRNNFSAGDYSIYSLFSDLIRKLNNCIENYNRKEIETIFRFARWCADSTGYDLSNAAGVSFYEDLFDNQKNMEIIISFLTKQEINDYMDLWEAMVPPLTLEQAKEIMKRDKKL